MADELGDLLLQYGAITRLRAAVELLSTRGDAEAALRKAAKMEQRHHAARERFVKRWSSSE